MSINDNDRQRGEGRSTASSFADFENFKKYFIDPMVIALEKRMMNIERQIEQNGERFDAAIRVFNDPTVGMVTRAELDLRKQVTDERIANLRREHNMLCEEEIRPMKGDIERIKSNQLPPWAAGAVALIVAGISAFASHLVWK